MKNINSFPLFIILALFCLASNAPKKQDQEELKKRIDIGYIEDHDNLPGRIAINRITNNYNRSVTVILINEYATPKPLRYTIDIPAQKQQEYSQTIVCNRVRVYVTAEGDSNIIDKYYNPKQSEGEKKANTAVGQTLEQTTIKETNTKEPNVGKGKKSKKKDKESSEKDDGKKKDDKNKKGDGENLVQLGTTVTGAADTTKQVAEVAEGQKDTTTTKADTTRRDVESNIGSDGKKDSSTGTPGIPGGTQTVENNGSSSTGGVKEPLRISIIPKDTITSGQKDTIRDNGNGVDSYIIVQGGENDEKAPLTAKMFDWINHNLELIGLCIGTLILFLILILWYKKANKKEENQIVVKKDSNKATEDLPAIIIRKETTAKLRKQSLEDVIDNAAYMKINCNDFCDDSAVRYIYIKNDCIKDIYNMYADDLRNPNKPNEDGCMVLGRWVYVEADDAYDVTLEHIVLPGDDAVFSEYELNFGGKIQIKVTEKLRKLRKETDLQYDLTCWVHSHPGLGVFFSNSDSNVQMQLKHPTHPNFLTAMVVDILTPQQELGIFTFKRDSAINSKADLKKMYSLEELYKWAIECDRNSYKPEDYYNTLAEAKSHAKDCNGIELSNGAIIDMNMLVAGQSTGLVGFIHGFSIQQGEKIENVAVKVTKEETVPDNELVGCFIISTHCSIPSLRKVVGNYVGRIKFILVYTTTDGMVTTIPVTDQEICTDDNCYGEQTLENLKIWTRRRR